MANSLVNPENFGFFVSSVPSYVRVADLEHAAACSQMETAFTKKLAQISEREGEDAVLTGGTRSLSRRLLALNISEIDSQPLALTRPQHPLSA